MGLEKREHGLYLEDFQVGQRIPHRISRTILDADNVWFTLLTNNTNEIHFNYELAGRSEFGKPLVVSTLTLAVITGLSVADVSASGVNLGWNSVVPTKPVFVGDTLSAESEVVSVRASKSRLGDGVLTVRTTGRNQHGEEVMVFERAILIPMREGAADGES